MMNTNVLTNARHERFAQALAEGQSASSAYVAAGYSENEGNAGRLNRNEQVQARVRDLQLASAKRVGISVESVTADLLRLARAAEAQGDAPGLSVARASLMDAARLNGLVVDKRQIDASVGFAALVAVAVGG